MVFKKIKNLKELSEERFLRDKEILELTKEKAKLSAQLAQEKAKLAHEKAKESVSDFRKEMNKSVNTAIIAAFSFLIALVWKDLITLYVERITQLSPFQGQLFSTILITIICVMGILLTTKLLSVEDKEKENNKQ